MNELLKQEVFKHGNKLQVIPIKRLENIKKIMNSINVDIVTSVIL